MNTLHKATKRPVQPDARCGKADLHGAACVLPAAHKGPCLVLPLEQLPVGDGELGPQRIDRW